MVGTGKEERDEGIELLHKKVVQFFSDVELTFSKFN